MLTEQQLLAQSEDQSSYMSDEQLDFFSSRLQQMREEIQLQAQHAEQALRDLSQLTLTGDDADKATHDNEANHYLRALERERELLPDIESAIKRIHDGEYGYCIETGEPIGLGRLLAQPATALSVEEMERIEQLSRHISRHD